MATYKEIHGVKVQYRDSDATAIEGDVWYNASTGLLKMYAAAGAWASGGNLTSAREQLGGSGIQTAGLVFGGNPSALTESYNGSTWTEVGDLSTGKANGGPSSNGTSTAALYFGGYTTDNSATNESYDGTSWTELADLNLLIQSKMFRSNFR